jgi:hypothetical protein
VRNWPAALTNCTWPPAGKFWTWKAPTKCWGEISAMLAAGWLGAQPMPDRS